MVADKDRSYKLLTDAELATIKLALLEFVSRHSNLSTIATLSRTIAETLLKRLEEEQKYRSTSFVPGGKRT